MTPKQFCKHYPQVYHMAEVDGWESICKHGLMSTTALLDFLEVPATQREPLESFRRPNSVVISHPKHGRFTIRDNKPITESKLQCCLKGMSPREWFETLNRKVFFWAMKKRVLDLLRARAYRARSHAIITVDSKSLVQRHGKNIVLSSINSGAMPYGGSPRGSDTFVSLANWPADEGPRSGKLKKPVVEVAVEYRVADIAEIAIKVEEMRKNRIIGTIWKGTPKA